MATRILCNDVWLAVEDSGGSGPAVLFSHGLLYTLRMWDAQIAALRTRFRCVAYAVTAQLGAFLEAQR